jgi:membrane protein implicated in regulation of membrane protease activity
MLFLAIGVTFAAYNIGGTVKIDFMNIHIDGSLGSAIIVLVIFAVLYDRYFKRRRED